MFFFIDLMFIFISRNKMFENYDIMQNDRRGHY